MNTKYFTGAGDAGATQINNKSYRKSDPFFQVLGKIDECNSLIGVARSFTNDKLLLNWLLQIQNQLFVAQADIAADFFDFDKTKFISDIHIEEIESIILEIDKKHDSIQSFVVPGGAKSSAFCDLARAVAREVERQSVKFEKELHLSIEFLKYFNRLSSVLFACARYANVVEGIQELKPMY